jgi:hypothetical protein
MQPPGPLIDLLFALGKAASLERVVEEEDLIGIRGIDESLFKEAAKLLLPRIHGLQVIVWAFNPNSLVMRAFNPNSFQNLRLTFNLSCTSIGCQ